MDMQATHHSFYVASELSSLFMTSQVNVKSEKSDCIQGESERDSVVEGRF